MNFPYGGIAIILLAALFCGAVYLLYRQLKKSEIPRTTQPARKNVWRIGFYIIILVNFLISLPINFLYFIYTLITTEDVKKYGCINELATIPAILMASLIPAFFLAVESARYFEEAPYYSDGYYRKAFVINVGYLILFAASYSTLTKSW